MNADEQQEKTLRLLLRAEFADFRLSLFQELQTKLDTKADRLPFELVAKDVAELKTWRDAEVARRGGTHTALGWGKTAVIAAFAATIAATDIVLRLLT